MNRTLKNIIVVYDYANINGGAAKVAIHSAIALSNEDYNVYYFAACGPIDDLLINSKVKVICLNMKDINTDKKIDAVKNGIWNTKAEKQFSSLCKKFSPLNTIIHIHGWSKALSSCVVKVASEKKFKSLITLHDYFTVCPNGGFYDYRKQKICLRDPMSISCILCNCDKRNYAQKLWRLIRQLKQDIYVRNNSNIAFISLSDLNEKVTRPFVKSNIFYRVQNPIQIAQNTIEDCSKSNIFIYAGRLSAEKGVDLFCKTITELKKRYNIRGIIVGGGECEKELKEKYSEIEFEGWKTPNEVAEYIQKSRVVVIPSRWYEASPLLLTEAYSAGLPAIISDCCAGVELIKNKQNGFLFRANDLKSLYKSMKESMNDITIKRIQDNIKNDLKRKDFSISRHIKSLIEVYIDWLNYK